MGGKKHTYEFIYNYFKIRDCELLEDNYKDNKQKLKFKCKCGNIDYISFNYFSKDNYCRECASRKNFTYEEVFNYFKSKDCELLENIYINTHTLMNYKCSCGNISYVRFGDFLNGTRCMKCSGKEKLTFEYVSKYFSDNKCELLEDSYINNSTKMRYKCNCGNESYIDFNAFQSGKRCSKCNESKGERKIFNYLENNFITFTRQYKISDCKNINPLPFDFALFDHNNLQCLIEYDGEQHFKEIEIFGGKQGFEKIKVNDSIKTKYCEDNKTPLLRIPYWEFNNIESTIDNFLLSFSKIEL